VSSGSSSRHDAPGPGARPPGRPPKRRRWRVPRFVSGCQDCVLLSISDSICGDGGNLEPCCRLGQSGLGSPPRRVHPVGRLPVRLQIHAVSLLLTPRFQGRSSKRNIVLSAYRRLPVDILTKTVKNSHYQGGSAEALRGTFALSRIGDGASPGRLFRGTFTQGSPISSTS